MDPWNWSVDEVVQNLCHESHLWIDRPHATRPEPSQFERTLRRENVDGATLLVDFNTAVLKDEFGIKSLGERSSINHALELLRNQSAKYHARARNLTLQHFIDDESRVYSPSRTPTIQSTLKREPSITPLPRMDSPRIRPGEVLVEHEGVKRRKLAVQPQTQHQHRISQALPQPFDSYAYIGRSKLSLNSVFFDNIAVTTDGHGQDESDSDDIAMISTNVAPPGQKRFVSRRLRYFFQSAPVEVSASQTIRHPYPERLASGTRYTSMFSIVGGDVLITKRDAVLLDHTLITEVTNSNEWDYIATKWQPKAEESEVGALRESEDEGYYAGSILSEIEEEEAEREERAKQKAQFMSKEDTVATVEDYIKSLRDRWNITKLPKREEKAWSIWRKASGHRQRSIELGHREIEHLDNRIEKLKSNICNDQWRTVHQIEAQCASLDVTVFEKLDKSWQLQILGKEAPPRPARKPYTPRAKKLVVSRSDDEESLTSSESEIEEPDQFEDIDEVVHSVVGPRTQTEAPTPALRGRSSESQADSVLGDVEGHETETDQTVQTHYIDLTELSSPSVAHDPVDEDVDDTGPDEAADDDYGANPENATGIDIDRWTWQRLEETSDRKRIVMKLLHSLEATFRVGIERLFVPKNENILKDKVQVALGAIKRQLTISKHLKNSENNSVFAIARIYVCWNDGSHRHFNEGIPDDIIYSAKKVPGFNDFYAFVKSIIKANDIESDESDRDPDTPKKRLVIKNRLAQQLRKNAQIRRDEGREREEKLRLQLEAEGITENVDGVIINPAKSDDESFIYINQYIGMKLKPHQIDGVRFLWREIVTVGETAQQGCLLAHTMGLGKTLQTITLLVTIAEASSSPDPKISNQIPPSLRRSRILILCPASLIENWVDELHTWVPPDTRSIGPIVDISAGRTRSQRIEDIRLWYQERGILVMGYDMFRLLLDNSPNKKTVRMRSTQEEHERLSKYLLSGPTIVVADEAHRLKNPQSALAIRASHLATTSRIALTGSPLANNLHEYYAMINWVAPGYLGDADEFRNYYQTPIEAGTYADSSKYDQRRSLKKLQVLKTDIDPKVHRADISVLQNDLKKKVEFLIKLPLTRLQAMAYTAFVQSLLHHTDAETASVTLMDWLSVLSLLCDHPAIFLAKVKERSNKKGAKTTDSKNDDIPGDIDMTNLALPVTLLQRLEDIYKEEGHGNLDDINNAYKTMVVEQIITHAKEAGDKVLIFSHWMPTLDYLEKAIKQIRDPLDASRSKFSMMRLDGKTPMPQRQSTVKTFNSGKADIFLISTRAGGLGLNITGANRVILMDFSWNPIWEEQAVGRAYRIGQTKQVFVYHLITGGTCEEKLHQITIFKRQLAARVVDKKNPTRAATKVNEMLFEPKEIDQEDLTLYKGMDGVFDKLLESDAGKSIRAVETTETLHRESDDKLTEEELKEVAEMIQDDRLRKADPDAWRNKNTQLQMRYFIEAKARNPGP